MSRNFSKLTAALFATLTISAAAASFTTDTASAWGRGERMGRMGHMMGHGGGHSHGHRHWHGGGRGFGRGMAIGMGAIALGALAVAVANQPSAESLNPATGERIRSRGKPGKHVVTKTDRDGNVVREGGKRKPDSATSVEGGRTATSTADGKGQRDVTENDNGNVKNSKSGGEPASMSWTDPSTGVTTTITSDGKGGSTMVRTNAAGAVLP